MTAGSSLKNPMYLFKGPAPIKEFAAAMPWPLRAGVRVFGRAVFHDYPYQDGYLLEDAKHVRAAVKLPMIYLGGVTDRAVMDKALDAGFQFVAMARALLMEPDLINRIKADASVGCVIGPDQLVGEWRIERQVSDLRADVVGEFTGTLWVSADGDGYSWHESGTLSWGDYSGAAERHLLLRWHEADWWMCFADRRLFHPWRVGGEVVHPCAADVYRGLVEAAGRDRFTITWDVTGPAKRQLIVSRMTRVQSALASTTNTPSTCTSFANKR